MAKKKQKFPLSMTACHAYLRQVRGHGVRIGESPIQLLSDHLADKLGWPRVTGNKLCRALIAANWQVVAASGVSTKRVKPDPRPKQAGLKASGVDVASDEFLNTYAWRSLRMKALIKHGRRCLCCGATPDDGVKMHVDHIKPRRLHPELALNLDNLQVLCEVCNHGKGNWDQTDWRKAS